MPFCVLLSCFLYFNSRPSARGDDQHHQLISIISHFNSRPSARGDGVKIEFEGRTYTFQFTPLREGRHTILCKEMYI